MVWGMWTMLVFHISCWINVWPIAISVESPLLLVVNTSNCIFLILFLYAVSPPFRILRTFVASLFGLFIVPYTILSYLYVEKSLFLIAVNDIALALTVSIFLSTQLARLRANLEVKNYIIKNKVQLLSGKRITEEIFTEKDSILKSRKRMGFLIDYDIRSFTSKVKNQLPKPELSLFVSNYAQISRDLLERHYGEEINSTGDGFLVFFGEGNRPELDKSGLDESLLHYADDSLVFVENLVEEFHKLGNEFGIPELTLGIGITYGIEVFEVIGGRYDIHSDLPTRANRIQAYTKFLQQSNKRLLSHPH